MNGNLILNANEWAAAWAPAVWRATWQGGAFIVAVWVVSKSFRRMPAAARSWLWWIASLQLFIRLIALSPIALPILPAHSVSPTYASNSMIQSEQPEVVTPVSSYTQAESPSTTAQKASLVAQAPLKATQPIPQPTAALIALTVWILGVATCLTVSLRRMLGTRQLLRGANLIESGPVFDLVQEFSIDYGVRQPPLFESDDAPCPLLAGWRYPAVVLPTRFTSDQSESQIRMAVAHEIAHLQRHDLWLGIVPAISQSLFFFHPLAWLATHEGAAAREAACDSEALRMSGGSPAAYARLLLDTAQTRSSMAVLGTAFGYRLIQRRISMLKTITASNARRYRSAGTLLIALGAICALPWSVTAQAAPPATPPKPATPAKKATKPAKTNSKKRVATKSHTVQPPLKIVKVANRSAIPATPTVNMRLGLVNPPPPRAPIAPSPARANASWSAATNTFAQLGGAMPPRGAKPPAQLQDRLAPVAMSGGIGAPPRQANNFLHEVPVIGNFFPKDRATPPMPSPAMKEMDEEHVTRINEDFKVQFDRVDIHKALQELFKESNRNIMIKSDVVYDTVTCSLHEVSFETALLTILASVKQTLTYRESGGVYTIMVKSKD